MTDTADLQPVDPVAPDANATPVAPADPSPAPVDAQPPKADWAKSRIDELTYHRREAERDRDHWRELALRNTQQPKQEPVVESKPKTLADFDYDESKFQSYLVTETTRQAREAAADEARKEWKAAQERESAERRSASFKSKEAEFSKTVKDYEQVTRDPSLRISQTMVEAIAESDDGPALAYHLGKNPEVAAKIASLPPIAAAKELGRIEAQLAFARESAKQKTVSEAPAPPPKVEGNDSAPVRVDPDDPESDKLSTAEWIRRRNKQIEKRSK